jgi:uncharacterized protein (DUF2126 family)
VGAGRLLHYGQGKWYPGESLPRWALGCYWRRDGGRCGGTTAGLPRYLRRLRFRHRRRQTLHRALADNLGVSRRYIRESYEDILYYLHKEQRLPVNVDPADPKLEDPEERARMVHTFERGLGAVVGYVLPLQHGSWKSGPWPFRGEHMFLLPGDSPAGLRLPLESLPWVSEADFPFDHPLDPMADREPLPDPTGQRSVPGHRRHGRRRAHPARPFDDPEPVVRRIRRLGGANRPVRPAPGGPSVCVHAACHRLLEGYLELVAAIEATAAANPIFPWSSKATRRPTTRGSTA